MAIFWDLDNLRPPAGYETVWAYRLVEAAFEYAAKLGYDGVELMVWAESVSQDIDAVAAMSWASGSW